MAQYTCKNCGVTLEINNNEIATTCECCGTQLTEMLATEYYNSEYQENKADKETKKRLNRKKNIVIAAILVVCVVASFVYLYNSVIIPNSKYNYAVELMETDKYEEAIIAFEALNGYKDSVIQIKRCKYIIADRQYYEAIALMEAGKYSEAIVEFEALNGHRDSEDQIENCKTAITDSEDYNKAIALMEAGEYEEAIIVFEELNGYKDSLSAITECRYNEALELIDKENYVVAYDIFKELGDYKDSEKKASDIKILKTKEQLWYSLIGHIISYGAYEQDNDTTNGKEDIEWMILDKEGDKVLLISRYALDCCEYDTKYEDITWENSSIRKWLNKDFMDNAFSAEERTMIATTEISPENNPKYNTDPENATKDQVFLLNIQEVLEKYFSSDISRQCEATDYAVAKGAFVDNNRNCAWWLRSPGYDNAGATYVVPAGAVNMDGWFAHSNCAVRPAIWIDCESYISSQKSSNSK